MIPASTQTQSNIWKLWHSCNYFIGGGTFFVGSVILFPFFGDYFDTDNVSAYLYSIGSFTFLVADITECLHFCSGCLYINWILNYSISILASALYLIGSILFIPHFDSVPLGQLLFDIGSCLIIVSQAWKLLPGIWKKGYTKFIAEDRSGFYVDFFSGIGGVMYLTGTLILEQSLNDDTLLVPAVSFYSIGGTCFFISSIFMVHRYFWQVTEVKNISLLESDAIESSKSQT